MAAGVLKESTGAGENDGRNGLFHAESQWPPRGGSLNWPPGMRSILFRQVCRESIRGSEGSDKAVRLAIQGMKRRQISCSMLMAGRVEEGELELWG